MEVRRKARKQKFSISDAVDDALRAHLSVNLA